MRIVTARVHHSDFLSVVSCFHLRRERQIDLLGYRQSIHVRAQCHDLAGPASTKNSDNAGVSDACLYFNAKASQMIGHDLRRACLAITELRMLMDIPPPSDDFAFDLSRAAIDFSCGWSLRKQ